MFTIFGKQIAGRLIAMAVGAILLIAIAGFGLYQCDQRRNEGAQSRVGNAQAGAQQESGADAINTVSAAGQREAGSEALTRDNERDIRAADGAGERVNMGVHTAGLQALCKRPSYANDPRCAPFRKVKP